VARELYSWNSGWNSIFLKADSSKSDVVNVDLSDIVVDCGNELAGVPIHIQTFDSSNACRNITIRNARVTSDPSCVSAVYIDATLPGTIVEEIHIFDLVVKNARLLLVQCYAPTNITIANCQVDGP
jgi:hypothetical protein